MNRIFSCFVLVLGLALPAAAQIGSGKSIQFPFQLPGGITGNLAVSFENVTDLSAANLGVSFQLVSPLDPGLLSRLPPTVSIPPGFPVLVRIEPTPQGGLAFTGVATVDLQGLGLPATPDALALLSAPLGAVFSEITDLKGTSTYRAIGSVGGFSEFLLVLDATPLDQAITAKLGRLDQILADNATAIAEPVRSQLAGQLAAIRADDQQGDVAAALQELDLFLATVEQHSGTEIPDLWRAARDRVNVAGLLRAGGRTLRFSLQLASGH